jgi:hypothetical protein
VQSDDTKRKPGRPRRNTWLALPIGFHAQLPYSLIFRGEKAQLIEWLYLRCVQLAAANEPIGQLSCSGIVPNSTEQVAEIFELSVSFVENAFKSFQHWKLLSIIEGQEGSEYFFRDAIQWTAGIKSTDRVQASRARAAEEE